MTSHITLYQKGVVTDHTVLESMQVVEKIVSPEGYIFLHVEFDDVDFNSTQWFAIIKKIKYNINLCGQSGEYNTFSSDDGFSVLLNRKTGKCVIDWSYER